MRRSSLVPALVALALAWVVPVQAQRQEPELKAQVLFQILLFVQWPGRAAETAFQFCTLDDTPPPSSRNVH